MRVDLIRAAGLDGVPHGFLGRRGGVSTGIFASLNIGLGSGDEPENVAENRARAVATILPDATLLTLYQVHSPTVIHVTEPFAADARPRADAMVTDRPGMLLGVLGADCAPVLFADLHAGVVGAAHAGWKGALAGVTDATIAAMEALGADRTRIAAAIGPCIAQESYEVDEAFRARFLAADPANGEHFAQGRPGHQQFDLPGYLLGRLARAGVARPAALHLDTYADADRFFSYRRATHRGETDYGRQVGAIGLA